MDDDIDWPLGEKKKLFYNKTLGLNVFVERIVTKARRKFNTNVHMFRILLKPSKKTIKVDLNLVDHNSSLVKMILRRLFSLMKRKYSHVENQIYFQIDIALKGNKSITFQMFNFNIFYNYRFITKVG